MDGILPKMSLKVPKRALRIRGHGVDLAVDQILYRELLRT